MWLGSKKLKVLSTVFLASVIFIIFYLTFQSHDSTLELSEGLRNVFSEEFMPEEETAEEVEQPWWNDLGHFRKLAHIPEYGLLGVAAAFFYYCHFDTYVHLGSFLFCMAVSLLDQTVKEFLPTRYFDASDLPLDFTGYVLGILFVTLVYDFLRYHTK